MPASVVLPASSQDPLPADQDVPAGSVSGDVASNSTRERGEEARFLPRSRTASRPPPGLPRGFRDDPRWRGPTTESVPRPISPVQAARRLTSATADERAMEKER